MILFLSSEAARKYAHRLTEAGANEIGGILMGEQLSPGMFRIVDFTVDEGSAKRDRFVRDMDRHTDALQAFFEKTGGDYGRFNYLGEWHSHPRFPVAPSMTDVTSMQQLVDGEESVPFAVLLILKLSRNRRLQASATLFQGLQALSPIDLRPEIEGTTS